MTREIVEGKHSCLLYSSLSQQIKNVFPFLKEGLERGQKVLYITSVARRELIQAELIKFDQVFESALKSGAMLILDYQATYWREGIFDPDRMMAFLQSARKEATRDGYKGMRGSAEMSWVFEGIPGSEYLIEYEARLSAFLQKNQISVICQYNQSEFGIEFKHSVLHTHPLIQVDGRTEPCTAWLGKVSDRH